MESQFISDQNLTGDAGENKVKDFFEKAMEYKQEIALGVTIVSSAVAMLGVIKSLRIEEVLKNSPLISESVSNSVTRNLPVSHIINVKMHVRTLPQSWKPSISKLESAIKNGISLKAHETLVDAYSKASAFLARSKSG